MAAGKKKSLIIAGSIIGVIIIMISIFTGILLGTTLIQKSIIRLTCQDKPSSEPKNYEEIVKTTTLDTVEYTEGNYLDVIEPKGIADDAICVLVFHGGYYVGGGRHNQEPYARLIASYGYRVLNIDYSLAPENIYPTQLMQANAALNYAETAYPQSKGMVVSGDSAGAHLAAQLAALVGNDELQAKRNVDDIIAKERLLGFVGNCGFYQASTVADTGFFLIDSAMQMLIGNKNYKDSGVISELDLMDYASSFTSTLLICGDKDPFLVQNTAMQQALKSSNIRVEQYFPTTNANDLGHEFQCNYNIEESYTAMDKIIEFLKCL